MTNDQFPISNSYRDRYKYIVICLNIDDNNS